ncbi:DNA cross-link repair 1A protein [Kwoniella heveanensis CBS 569]|nr:DNA cross-link repair 1A protein [Kwoniella heveanensis CBS 569]
MTRSSSSSGKNVKRPAASPKNSGSGSGNILNFFTKTPTRRTSTNASTVEHEAVKVEPLTFIPTLSTDRKGKGKAVPLNGSVEDPVVISDDEDEILALPPPPTVPRSKRQKVQSPFPVAGPSRSPELTKPSASPGHPEFEPPPTWPEVINVGASSHLEPDEMGDDEDEDGIPPSDEDGNRTQDPAEGDDGENDDSGLDMDIDEVQAIPEPIHTIHPDGMGHVQSNGGGVDQDMDIEWEEPEDEGMGMEEDEGDDEASVISEPVGRGKKRNFNGGVKVNACPVCGMSLKGKVDKVAQHHINSCLDTSLSSKRKARPISAYASFSPAPSPSPEPEQPTKGPNAFSVLMSGHKEKEQWKDAEIDLKRDGKRTFGRRKAPFYKVLTGMPVAVDAFRYGAVPKVTAYLLTHAHSDHYTNLSKSWCHGPIYCSQTTANLIIHMLGVEQKWVHGLPNDVPFEMPNTGGVTVMPIEANHCPGSSIFLFEGPQTVNAGDSGFKSPFVGSKRIFRYLHCGDFRACPKMVLHPAIARAPIHTCYLDTTYLNPKYCFPPQPQVINACAALARKTVVGISATAPTLEDLKPQMNVKLEEGEEMKPHAEELEEKSKAMMAGWLVKKEEMDDVKEELREVGDVKPKGRTLVVMGTYSIGKERIVKAVAKALGSTIYCDPRKKGILLCQTDPELHSLLSTDPFSSQVHLLPLGNIQLDRLQPYLARLHPHFDRVLALRPTGWSYSPPAGTDMLPDVNTVIKRDQARWFSDRDLKPMRGSCRTFQMFGVPYSEHSSFTELTCFALSMPGADLKMIATVNVGNEKSRAKMKKWFEKWAAEKARRREKGLPQIVEYRDETYW